MSFALAFLVLPITMHRGTRQALPGSTVTALLPWLQEDGSNWSIFQHGFDGSNRSVEEAIMFGVDHGALAIADGGGLVVGIKEVATTEKKTELFTSEARECIDRAAFLGRWLSVAGTPATILAAWGVAP